MADARENAIASVLSEIVMEDEIVVSSVIRDFHQEKNSEIISDISIEILQKGTSTIIKTIPKVPVCGNSFRIDNAYKDM